MYYLNLTLPIMLGNLLLKISHLAINMTLATLRYSILAFATILLINACGNGNKAEATITNTPPTVSLGEDISVIEFNHVSITPQITDKDGTISTTQWRRLAGPSITLPKAGETNWQFTAPNVDSAVTYSIELTVTDNQQASNTDTINITVLPQSADTLPMNPIHVPEGSVLLTQQRVEQVYNRIKQDDSAWQYLTNKISYWTDRFPYNAGEYAAAFTLAYYISQEQHYMDRAIELLKHQYFEDTEHSGWSYYQSRNMFRTDARWASMGYTWIKPHLSEQEQQQIEGYLTEWTQYWLAYVHFNNDFQGFNLLDTDEVTSLAENLTLLGYALKDSTWYSSIGMNALKAGDELLNRFVVNHYMNDIMAGGIWAEGSDYSPNTIRHWIRLYAINKEMRGIEYPNNYGHLALQGLLHQTLANNTGVYKYGSEERATDYEPITDDYRYELAFELMGMLTDPTDLAAIYQWFHRSLDKDGFKTGSSETGFQRLLYFDPLYQPKLDETTTPTFMYASGVGLIASRTDWSDNATNLYFINRNLRVDHEHQDALSFDLAYKGQWITKETTGYAGFTSYSVAHNTLTIENASDTGTSSPTMRPAGNTKYHYMYDDKEKTLISADATQAYNMSGYYATNYAKQVNRQIAFLKPNIVIVYDHVETDPTQVRDLVAYHPELGLKEGESNHNRWVRVVQHVQQQPSKISDHHYQVDSENVRLNYQIAWPTQAKVDVIDEKQAFSDAYSYNLLENQKKWHFQVSNQTPVANNEFITVLSFDDISNQPQPLTTQILTPENGFITSGDAIGIIVEGLGKHSAVIFDRHPGDTENNATVSLPRNDTAIEVIRVNLQ